MILSDFWKAAGLESLYRGYYREEIARLAARYDARGIEADLGLVQGYARLAPEETAAVVLRIVPNPFDSRMSAYSSAQGRVLYRVEAPSDTPTLIDTRAYLHLFVDPLVRTSPAVRSEVVLGLAAANRERPLVKGVREGAADFVSECLVRALAYRIEQARDRGRDPGLLDRLWKRIQEDSDGGLTLVPWFFAELARFEADESISLAGFIDSAFARLGR